MTIMDRSEITSMVNNMVREATAKHTQNIGENVAEAMKPFFAELSKPVKNKLLFGNDEPKQKHFGGDDGGFDNFQSFLKCVKEKNYSALEHCRPVEKEFLAAGSFIIPSKFQNDIQNAMETKAIIQPMCVGFSLKPGEGETLNVPCIESYDFSAGKSAGIEAFWTGENVAYQNQTPTLRQCALRLNKLTILVRFSEELLFASPVNTSDLITQLFGAAAAYKLDSAFINGTGTGQPKGILAGGDLIVIDGESGQTTNSLIFENVANLVKSLTPGAWADSVWLCNIANIPSLLTMSYKVGTSAIPVNCFNESNGKFTLLGRPVYFSQFTGALGEANSLILCNFKRYMILSRNNMMIRSDEGKSGDNFEKDIISMKFTYYVDGQNMDNSTTLLTDGNTVANFVTINAI